MTTFTTTHPTTGDTATRTSKTRTYTHAVWGRWVAPENGGRQHGGPGSVPGVLGWSGSAALAESAARTWRNRGYSDVQITEAEVAAKATRSTKTAATPAEEPNPKENQTMTTDQTTTRTRRTKTTDPAEAAAKARAAKEATPAPAATDLPDLTPEQVTAILAVDADRKARIIVERKALKTWQEAGGCPPAPATPVLDAVANGKKPAVTVSRSTKTVEPEAPKAGRGEVVVELRNVKHGETVATAIGEAATVVGRYLVLPTKPTSAQAVFDALIAAQDGAPESLRRRLQLAALLVRQHVASVTDERTSAASKLVSDLIAADVEWAVGSKQDCSLTFTVAGVEAATVGAAAELLAKAVKLAKRSTKKS